MRTTPPSHSSTPATAEATADAEARPANRAERRAAARGKAAAAGAPGGPAPRKAGPGVQVKALHKQNDFTTRKSG